GRNSFSPTGEAGTPLHGPRRRGRPQVPVEPHMALVVEGHALGAEALFHGARRLEVPRPAERAHAVDDTVARQSRRDLAVQHPPYGPRCASASGGTRKG